MPRIINLLPQTKQQELKYESLLHGVIKAIVISLFGFVLVGLIQLGTRLYLQHKAAGVQSEIESVQRDLSKDDDVAIKSEVSAINDIVHDFQNLKHSQPQWSKVLRAFIVLPPENVRINYLTVDIQRKTVNISGYAPTREDVIQLYNNILADSKEFVNIDYPLENVAKAKNNSFHFTFTVKDELLH